MPRIRQIATLALLAALLVGAPSFAQDFDLMVGQTPGGAFYTIAVPAPWNGGLVIYNHGFSLEPVGPGDLGPLSAIQIVEGYAVAASSYQQSGWALFKTKEDLEQLVDVFRQQVGTPQQVFLFGASLGGLVTAQAIEQANLGNVVGALPICGVMAGSRYLDGALDARLTYDAICSDVPGANIPGGAKGLPFGSQFTIGDIVLAMNACFGHDLPDSARTAAQQKRLDRFLAVMKIPQSFINNTLGFFSILAMADLVHDPAKLNGGIGSGNANVDYGDPGINADIQRVKPRAAKRDRLRRNYTPSGNVGNVKIVSIHTDKDGLVIVENQSEYASVVPPGNLTVGVVQEAVPTHCGFSATETLAAWETLRGWVAGDPQPSPLVLQVMCKALEPTFGGPCRFNPFFQIPDIDGRVRPRNPGNKVLAGNVNEAVAPAGGPTAPSPAAAPSSPESAPTPVVEAEPSRAPREPLAMGDSPRTAEVESRMSKRLDREER